MRRFTLYLITVLLLWVTPVFSLELDDGVPTTGAFNVTVDSKFNDDICALFGTSSDFCLKFDSANGWLELSDGVNDFLRIVDDGTTATFTFLDTISVLALLLPGVSGGADIGSTLLEWGDVYIATDKQINFGDGQEFNLAHESANLHLGFHDGAGNEFFTLEDIGTETAANLFGSLDIHKIAGSAAATSYEGFGIHMNVGALDTTSTMHGAIFDLVGSSAGEKIAIGVFPGLDVLIQHTGSFVTPDQGPGAATFAGRLVDPDGSPVFTEGIDTETLFVSDDDEIYIGSTGTFTELRLILTTPANRSIGQPPNDAGEYYFRNTGNTWVQFFPLDGTDGFTMDGIVSWDATDLTAWKSDYDPFSGNSATGYWIKIRRTRGASLTTTPVPTTIKILSPTNYSWDANGNLTIASISRGKSTLTVTGPTDDLDVSGINVVQVNTNGNNVTIGAFTGGVDGQQLAIVIVEASNNTILEHNEGTGNQNIFLESAADETKTATYGGWILECDGSNWYQTGGGGGGGGVSAGAAVFTGEIAYADPTTHTTTLTGFHAGNQTQTANITSLPGDNVTVRRLRVYISTDPTASENDQFRLSFYSDDGYTEDDLLWSDFFNLTYSEVLTAQWNSTDTSGDIDTSAGLVKYDLIRMLGGTPENQRVTAITDADTIAFTALVGNHAVDEGVVRVYEYTDAFMLFDDDDSAEIHAKLENFGTFAASASVVIEVDIQ